MTVNPYKDNTKTAKRLQGTFSLNLARVTEVKDDSGHQVKVEIIEPDTGEDLQGGPIPASVSVAQIGDIAVPSNGDVVIVGRFKNRRPVVIGTVYTRQKSPRSYSSEERHIGADSSDGLFLHGPFAAAPKRDSDPQDAPDGSLWYRTDLDEYRGVEDGTTVSFDTTAV